MKHPLIAFTGPAGSGKDTAAAVLIEEYGYVRVPFAQGLKDMLAAIGLAEPANRDDKEKPLPQHNGISWRHMAQTLGTEWGRGLYQDFWVAVARERILKLDAPVVITDMRFENEAAMVRSMGGVVVHISGRAADLGDHAKHASEAGIASGQGDLGLFNTGSLESLAKAVRQIAGGVTNGR